MTRKPLGQVQTAYGPKDIYPMDDIFINYTFSNPENWETLRTIANIMINAYRAENHSTQLEPITGTIKVETQYKHFKNPAATPPSQDLRLEEIPSLSHHYIELQSEPRPQIPISARSINYFGLGISKVKGDYANQLWLIAGDIPEIFNGQHFARYTLKDEKTNAQHPHKSGILYVNLKKLSQEDTTAGKLAAYLLGQQLEGSQDLATVTEQIHNSFIKFQQDKEVPDMISLQQRWLEQGEARGEARGEAKATSTMLEKLAALVKDGIIPNEVLQQLSE